MIPTRPTTLKLCTPKLDAAPTNPDGVGVGVVRLEVVLEGGDTMPVENEDPLVGAWGCPSGMTVTTAAVVVAAYVLAGAAALVAAAVVAGADVALMVRVTPTDAHNCWANASVSACLD